MQGAPDGYEFLTVIEGGTINGNVVAVNYDGSDATAQIVVSGPAQINGDVVAYDRSSGSLQPVENGDGVLIQISDGTFAGSVDADFVVPGAGFEVDESGNLVAVEAKLVAASDKVVDGVYTLDVTNAQAVTEADLLARTATSWPSRRSWLQLPTRWSTACTPSMCLTPRRSPRPTCSLLWA